ncbi:hypothetical protein OEB96_26185 [Paraliomyxa miuraensis]|nr:hypothetical protein [Paraliomyxa miuraensis]
MAGVAVAALAGLAVAVATTGLLRWLGTATLLTTAPVLLRLAADHPWWQRRRARLPLALFLALVVLMLGPLLRGEPPASRDHGIHYYQVRLLIEELIPSGRLWGWSPSLNNGYPFGESYPVLGYLWMAAAHVLSFGLISLRTSYAWGFAALWMLSAAVAWWLASLVTRELRTGASSRSATEGTDAPQTSSAAPRTSPADAAGWAGLAAAALWLLDPGGSRQGGWNYLVYHGVWPQLLCATLWAASIGLTFRAFGDPRPRRLALAVLALGGSLWAHPFGLLTITASVLAWAVIILVAPHRWPGPWRTFTVVHLGGALLGMGWVATFFGSADEMARDPVSWEPLAELGRSLVQGQLFAGPWSIAGTLALLGGAVALRRGGALAWAVVGLVIGQLVLASEDAITVLRLDLVLSGFKNLQFPRYSIPLKPLWFALAGVGVGRLVQWVRAHRGGEPRPLEPGLAPGLEPGLELGASAWVRRGAAGLLLAPLVATLVPDAGRLAARPLGALDTLDADELATSEAELLAALRSEAAALPPERPLVVALMRSGMGGGTYPLFSISDAGGRLVLDSHVPTVNFKHRVRRKATAYAALGVTHVIHDRPVPDKERSLASALEEVGQYGPFTLERFVAPHYEGPRVAELEGFGTMQVLLDEPEHLQLRVDDIIPGTTLAFGRAPHLRWELTLDGEVLEPRLLRRDGGLDCLGVDLPGPGVVDVHYVVTPFERRALWISAAMLLMCVVGLLWRGPPLALHGSSLRARRIAWVAFGVGVILAVAVIARRQHDKLERTWVEFATNELDDDPDDERAPELVRDLADDGAIEVDAQPARVCSGLMGKNVLEGCSEAAHAPSTAFLYREPFLYRCLRISIPSEGTTVLQFPAFPDDQTVVLGVLQRHVHEGSGKGLKFGSRWINQVVANDEHEFVLDRRSHGEAPTLSIRNEGRMIEQVCVAAAFVRRP